MYFTLCTFSRVDHMQSWPPLKSSSRLRKGRASGTVDHVISNAFPGSALGCPSCVAEVDALGFQKIGSVDTAFSSSLSVNVRMRTVNVDTL